METIKLYTYPQGVANKLGQDTYVQRLNELNRFDDCLVVDLDEGDQYFVHPRALPSRTPDDILNFIEDKQIDIQYNTDVDGKTTSIELYSWENRISHTINTSSLVDAINFLMDMDEQEL
jgi:hypothetical protein